LRSAAQDLRDALGRLSEMRAARGMALRKAAEAAGISTSTWRAVHAGATWPSLCTVGRLAYVLDCRIALRPGRVDGTEPREAAPRRPDDPYQAVLADAARVGAELAWRRRFMLALSRAEVARRLQIAPATVCAVEDPENDRLYWPSWAAAGKVADYCDMSLTVEPATSPVRVLPAHRPGAPAQPPPAQRRYRMMMPEERAADRERRRLERHLGMGRLPRR